MAAAVTVLLAGTLAWAGVAKLVDPAPFRATMRALGPERLAPVVPVVELILAALLVAGLRVTAALVLVLLAAFTVALTRLGEVGCNCFGATTGDDGRARNALLAAGALFLVIQPAGALWGVAAGELAGAATVAAGLACVWQLGAALR